MDNEKDIYIKEKLQNDKLISKNADDIINKFFDMEDVKMEENKNKVKSKKLLFSEKWKKILVTAASLVIIFGVANVYASTRGYGNIFFLIKYLITGENNNVTGKEEILTDRDLTISYEPINITDKINVVIKKLQIKNNEARLFILVNEQENLNGSFVPLKYKVYNDENKLLCDQKSNKDENSVSYTDELILSNYKENNTKLKLEIYSAKSELITTINIDLKKQTIEVVGEQEALSKISEIELKKFLNYVSGLSRKANGISKDEVYIDLAIGMLVEKDISNGKTLMYKNRDVSGFLASDVDEMINYSFSENNIKNFKGGNFITKTKDSGKDYYIYNDSTDFTFEGECININNISYCNGIYTVTYTFYLRGGEPDDDVNINNYEIFEQTVYIRLNDNNKFSKFKLISEDNAEIISGVGSNSNVSEENHSANNTNTTTNTNTSTTNTVNNTNTSSSINNTSASTNNNGNNNTISYTNTTVSSDNNQTNNNENMTVDQTISNNDLTENINNYASTMSWTGYWAPGIKFQYPTEFELVEEGGYYRGNNQGELTTRITGIAVGKNPDTNERVESKLMIKIYNPAFISESEANIRMYSNGYERGSLENKRGIKWYVTSNNSTNEQGYTYSESYSNIERTSDGSYIENRIEFVTDNIDNYKVRNIINWLLGTTQLTSW